MDGRTKSAVLVIDVQNDVVVAAHDRDGIVARIASVVDQARELGAPVVWIQHDDEDLPAESDGWQIVPELVPVASETIVRKQRRSSFESTDLEQILSELNVGRLLVTGAQTDFCVRWTLHSAQDRGYETVLVGDAHTTDAQSPAGLPTGAEIIAHTNAIWQNVANSDSLKF